MTSADAIVVGSGPNGLAAAVILARAGLAVTVVEAATTPGGGARTVSSFDGAARTDSCSAVHPMAGSSEFFRRFELTQRIRFTTPTASFAHALDGGGAVAYRDLERTVDELGTAGGQGWRRVFRPLVDGIDEVRRFSGMHVRPTLPAALIGARLAAAVTAGMPSLRSDARALAAGASTHAAAGYGSVSARAVGAVLAAEAHVFGWPLPVGGSSEITRALTEDLTAYGGTLELGHHVMDLREAQDRARMVLLDTSPRAFADMSNGMLPPRPTRVSCAATAMGRQRARLTSYSPAQSHGRMPDSLRPEPCTLADQLKK